MDLAREREQVRLTVLENEPLARLAEQRLQLESIPCLVRSLGAGPGGWGAATNLPHAIYVKSNDEMHARQVLDLSPAEISERHGPTSQPTHGLSTAVIALLIITAAALLFGIVELLIKGILR